MNQEETANRPEVKLISIRSLFASKKSGFIRFIPGFVISYLERLIHQYEINRFLIDFRDDMGLDFVDKILGRFGVNIRVEGAENLQDSRYLIASNHPLGGLDGLVLMDVVGKINPNVCFPVNDLLMNLPNLKPLFIPVNKHGSNAQNVQIMEETFASDKWMLYFPAGMCSRKQKGQIIDLEWKKTFISKAKKHKRDIIPVHMEGRNSNFFYNLANLRKFLKIKANIEMMFLSDEMFNQKDKQLVIRFGKSIPWSTFDKRFSDQQWAGLVKEHVYRIGKGTDDFNSLIASKL
jgi:putative hemolysin